MRISGDKRKLSRTFLFRPTAARIMRIVFPKQSRGVLGEHSRELTAHLEVSVNDAARSHSVILREGPSEPDGASAGTIRSSAVRE